MVIVRTGIWIAIAAILAGYVIHGYATLDRSDDRTQITSLIANAAKAAQSHNLGGAISCISINLPVNSPHLSITLSIVSACGGLCLIESICQRW